MVPYQISILALAFTLCQANPATESYLLRAVRALELAQSDIPAMTDSAEEAARRLAGGGHLWAAGDPSFVSELTGRAGGLMLIAGLGNAALGPNDVVMYGAHRAQPEPEALRESSAFIIAFQTGAPERPHAFDTHATAAGISPTLGNIISAWLYTAELVSALTRLGKMPVVFETIGLPGGFPRIQKYQAQGILWHETHRVSPVPPGELARRYVNALAGMILRIERDERNDLDRAGAWVAQAKSAGRRAILYTMGHFPPYEVRDSELGRYFETAEWNSGFSSLPLPNDTYAEGDVVLHIGYQHPPYELFERARPAGARVVYVDLHPHRDYTSDPNVIWIDPMWPWSDGAIELDGYEVPLLPPSGIINAAIAWEIFRIAHGVRP